MSPRRGSFARLALPCLVALALSGFVRPAQAGSWDWATGPSIYDKEGERPWEVELVPYIWFSSITGTLGLPPVGTLPVDATFSDLAENLDFAFMGVLDARYRRWHLLVDGAYVSLQDTVVPPQPIFTSATVNSPIGFGTVGIGYELPLDWAASVEPYLGARWWLVGIGATLETTLAPPSDVVSGSRSRAWADAVVGSRVRYAITEKWGVGGLFDIGAGSSNLTWQVLGNVKYSFNSHFGLSLGYRILGVDFKQGGFVYDVIQHGLVLGIHLSL